jgi:hypothetical protein
MEKVEENIGGSPKQAVMDEPYFPEEEAIRTVPGSLR